MGGTAAPSHNWARYSIVSMGVSNCASTSPALRMIWTCASRSAGLKAEFAPGVTTMMLSPSGETTIMATPELSSTVPTAVTSTPACSRPERNRSPKASLPTLPIMCTGCPSRATATAWFAPLPPKCVLKSSPRTVSPETGIRSAFETRSILMLPTTTIAFWLRDIYLPLNRYQLEKGRQGHQREPYEEQYKHPEQIALRPRWGGRELTPDEDSPGGGNHRGPLPNGVGDRRPHNVGSRCYKIQDRPGAPDDPAQYSPQMPPGRSCGKALHGYGA